jgi:shikimate kinase
MNVFLIGMMGSGKTTIGKNLAKVLNYQFIDTDKEIENLLSKSISQIFEEEGEAAFRKKEEQVLNALIQHDRQVIATGGGLPCFNNLMELINTSGISVYLKAEPAFLASRLKTNKEERPLIAHLTDDELLEFLNQLLSKREAYYCLSAIKIPSKDLKVKVLAHKIIEFHR